MFLNSQPSILLVQHLLNHHTEFHLTLWAYRRQCVYMYITSEFRFHIFLGNCGPFELRILAKYSVEYSELNSLIVLKRTS